VSRPPARDGYVHVCRERCATCIFWPDNRMNLMPGRLADIVKANRDADGALVCHSTIDGDNAICRGFYETVLTWPLQVAQRLGLVREVDPPSWP
jgi:hypothetical protein